jgi:hypothetical protein
MSSNVIAAVNDGGSVQFCNDCQKIYKGKMFGSEKEMLESQSLDLTTPSRHKNFRYVSEVLSKQKI